jgi:hypothetical protein
MGILYVYLSMLTVALSLYAYCIERESERENFIERESEREMSKRNTNAHSTPSCPRESELLTKGGVGGAGGHYYDLSPASLLDSTIQDQCKYMHRLRCLCSVRKLYTGAASKSRISIDNHGPSTDL